MQNWTWEECRQRYKSMGTFYEKLGLEFPDHSFSEDDKRSSQRYRKLMNKMIPLIDALESNLKLIHMLKRVVHLSLQLGLPDSDGAIWLGWDDEIEKYYVSLSLLGYEKELVVSLEDAIPTIKRNIQRLQDIENEQDNHPE